MVSMDITVQYVSDVSGNTQAVQLPLAEWKKVLKTIRRYEQALQLRSDLDEALTQVAKLGNDKKPQTLSDFLNEL